MPDPASPRHLDTSDADRLVAVSTTYRELSTERRESFAGRIQDLRAPFAERVLLHTCHRVELFGVLRRPGDLPRLPGARVMRGTEAAERAALVAGGLDSAVVGEEQILGQVRDAYRAALEAGDSGPLLNELLRRAIRFGKRVHSEAQPAADRSLGDRAVRWAAERLGPEALPASALVVGTGEMGRLLAARLAASGATVTMASRTLARAASGIAQLPNPGRHRTLHIDEVGLQAGRHDVVAIAIRASTFALRRADLPAGGRLPLVIDLSAPGAVEPAAAALLGDRLLDLDRLGSLAVARSISEEAERRLRVAAAREATRFVEWWGTRASGDGIGRLHALAAEIRERHLERLRRRGDLSPEQLSAVETAARAMLGELLHAPTLRLQHDPEAAESVRRIFGLDR